MTTFNTILILGFILFFSTSNGQSTDKFVGSYIKIDSTSTMYQKAGVWYADIDTTLLTLHKDLTFTYKWSPVFGPYSKSHIVTTGTWKISKKKIILNSKYQQDEYQFFEDYKQEYGDSTVKIYVQTYDSLVGYFQMQFIGVQKDTSRYSQMIFIDKTYPYNACSATFKLSTIDKIIFYGDFGQMPAIKPKNKNSNYFLLQYNLSTNWDYQYFKDFPIKLKGENLILGKKRFLIELQKL